MLEVFNFNIAVILYNFFFMEEGEERGRSKVLLHCQCFLWICCPCVCIVLGTEC